MVAEGATHPWIEKLAKEMGAPETSLDQYFADWLAGGARKHGVVSVRAYLDARRVAKGHEIVDQAMR